MSRPLAAQTSRRQVGLQLVRHADAPVDWADYPRIKAGEYPAFCRSAKWYWDPGFKRWTCLLKFDVLDEAALKTIATVPWWLNGGSGKKPKAGRRTRYWTEWVRANGAPPSRKDRLSPNVFIRRIAKVSVGDTNGISPYSVIRQVIQWSTGTLVNLSHSQGRHPEGHLCQHFRASRWQFSGCPSDATFKDSAHARVEV